MPKRAAEDGSGAAPTSSHSFGGTPEAPPAHLASDHREERRPTKTTAPLGVSFAQDTMSGKAARERAAFELMVLAVGAAVAPKLTPRGGEDRGGSWGNGGDEASSSWGEGDGDGEDRGSWGEGDGGGGGGAPLPLLGLAGALAAIPPGLVECGVRDPRLLLAWERACLTPLAPRPPHDAPAQGSTAATLMHRMAPRHLAAVAAGLGAMRLLPGVTWQAAFFDALLCRLHRLVLQ